MSLNSNIILLLSAAILFETLVIFGCRLGNRHMFKQTNATGSYFSLPVFICTGVNIFGFVYLDFIIHSNKNVIIF